MGHLFLMEREFEDSPNHAELLRPLLGEQRGVWRRAGLKGVPRLGGDPWLCQGLGGSHQVGVLAENQRHEAPLERDPGWSLAAVGRSL